MSRIRGWAEYRVDRVQSVQNTDGQNTEWVEYRVDRVQGGQNTERTEYSVASVQGGYNTGFLNFKPVS